MWLVILSATVLFAGLILWFAYSSLPAPFERWVQRLTASGSVEGSLFIDGEPAPEGTQITCCFVRITDEAQGGFEIDERRTRTGSDGRFRFPFIPVGEAGVGRLFTRGGKPCGEVDRRVEVRAGESTCVELGSGRGRVRGRLVAAEGFSPPDNWERIPPFWLVCCGPAPGAEAGAQVTEYSGNWRAIGANDRDLRRDYLRWRYVPVAPDGTFEVSGLHPGEYVLEMGVNERGECQCVVDCAELRPATGPLAHGLRRIVVPPSRDGEIVEVDAGDVLLHASLLQEPGNGDINGTLYIDGTPAPEGTTVECDLSGVCWDFCRGGEPEFMGCYHKLTTRTTTRRGGEFAFESLPEGRAEIAWHGDRGSEDSVSDDGYDPFRNEVEVDVTAGALVEVRLDCTANKAGTAAGPPP